MMIRALVLVGLASVAASFICVVADEIVGFDDVSSEEIAKLQKLTPYLVKLNGEVGKNLPEEDGEHQAKCMEMAKERLDKLTSGCLGACSLLMKTEKEALELFVALEDTLDRCDTQTYEILYRNKIAHDINGHYPFTSLWHTYRVVLNYLELYAEHCGPVYKEKFADTAASADRESFGRVEKAFFTLTTFDFGYWGEHIEYPVNNFDLVGMKKPEFKLKTSKRSLVKIVQQIGELIRESSDPATAKYAEPNTTVEGCETLKSILDEYLFGPCNYYRMVSSTIMNKARFAASIEYGQVQEDYIYGDEKFHRALIANRLCGSLLEDREQLYEPFYHAWNYMLDPGKSIRKINSK